jgi:hypothetical protein
MTTLNLVMDFALMGRINVKLTLNFRVYLIRMSVLLIVNVLKVLKAFNSEDFLSPLEVDIAFALWIG